MTKRITFLLLWALILVRIAPAAVPETKDIVHALVSADMHGRGLGTEGIDRAADHVRDWLQAAGCRPGVDGQWFHDFEGPRGVRCRNVVGEIEGGTDEWILVGAHYDGLGIGMPGTEFAGQIFPGADDNASGVAALVRVASALAAEASLDRTVRIVAFTGEESGLLGSRALVDAWSDELEHARAMLNLDMVGRLREDRLIVFGSKTADEFGDVLKSVNFGFRFDLALQSEGAGASDHRPFFEKGIPVLHFFSGAQPEMHRPSDVAERLNFGGIERISDYVTEIVRYFSSSDVTLTYRPVGTERLWASGTGRKRRVSFGSIPDFSRESGGVLLSGVMPGGAAEGAGLQAGDVLVGIEGLPIDNIYDFQGILAEHEPGDEIRVTYRRDESEHVTTLVLRERR